MGSLMLIGRRDAVKAIISGAASGLLPLARAQAVDQGPARRISLGNGLRIHFLPDESGYVLARLVLRSKEITHNGLAHLFEHTSSVGAAGALSADDLASRYKDYIQEGNASTEPGALTWDASFLPHYLPQVLDLLAAITLDQKFNSETVEAQARVVLQELYLDKYDADKRTQRKFDCELFGGDSPLCEGNNG